MKNNATIEIPLSKKKLMLLTVGSLVFVIAGIWLIRLHSESNNLILKYTAVRIAVGIMSILFFGLTLILNIIKILDKKMGLIISQNGIIDNSSGISAGLISWSEIENIDYLKISNQEFLIIEINDPEAYLLRIPNTWKRKIMGYNLKKYGSPILISASALKINIENLHNILIVKRNEFKL